MRLLILTAVVLFQFVANPAAQAQQPAALSVGTVPAERRPVTRASEFVGRVEAVERVDIHARVIGFLKQLEPVEELEQLGIAVGDCDHVESVVFAPGSSFTSVK